MLGNHPDVSSLRQERILLDLVEQYVAIRCPDQMVYGRMHLDTDYLHFHLCISANTVRGKQRRWLSRSDFDRIQREIENYKIKTYPELGDEKYYDHAAKKKRREKARRDREDKAKLSQKEIELKKRTGELSQKEQDRQAISEIFATGLSELELTHRLAQLGFETYVRGNTEGVVNTITGRKYRLGTLGLEPDLRLAKDRIRVYQDRVADIGFDEAKTHRDKDGRDFKDDNGRER